MVLINFICNTHDSSKEMTVTIAGGKSRNNSRHTIQILMAMDIWSNPKGYIIISLSPFSGRAGSYHLGVDNSQFHYSQLIYQLMSQCPYLSEVSILKCQTITG